MQDNTYWNKMRDLSSTNPKRSGQSYVLQSTSAGILCWENMIFLISAVIADLHATDVENCLDHLPGKLEILFVFYGFDLQRHIN